MKAIKTILHPTDFSKHSIEALDLAGSLARDRCARLVILHVVPSAPAVIDGGAAAVDKAERRARDLENYRHEMLDRLHRMDVPAMACPAERILVEGDAAREILRKADEFSCDLIVMGTHGRSADFGRLMGSVAEEVSHKAPCPVLTVKTAGGDAGTPAFAHSAGLTPAGV
jgi:universal stress protein A